jgi:carbamoyl-phosphate synthase large subunit
MRVPSGEGGVTESCQSVQIIKSILIIGAGPIVIGQACEFDYSGAQACKALREEGYRVILVNSNPATIMTDPVDGRLHLHRADHLADRRQASSKKSVPDAVLPTMGGQTALNCALDLDKHGVLEKFNVELIGASKDAIRMAEDRKLFDQAMRRIGLECPRAGVAHSMEEAFAISTLGFPASSVRPSPWAAPAAASPTTAKNSWKSASAV